MSPQPPDLTERREENGKSTDDEEKQQEGNYHERQDPAGDEEEDVVFGPSRSSSNDSTNNENEHDSHHHPHHHYKNSSTHATAETSSHDSHNTNNDMSNNNNDDNKPEHDPADNAPPRRRRQKQLSTDKLNWNIPHNHDALQHVQEEEGDDSWRYKLLKVLHGRRVQLTLACLLLLDVLILFCELSLLTFYPTCNLVERDAISCCPILDGPTTTTSAPDDNAPERWLAGKDGYYFACEKGHEPLREVSATCDSHKWDTVHTAEDVLISVTLIILSTFFLELTLCMIALTPKIFFRQVFYAVDYFIVTVSLGLETLFFSLDDNVLTSLVGLVIMGRLWRFIRIGHGIVELTEELSHEQHLQEMAYTAELEYILERHGIALPDYMPRQSSTTHPAEMLERLHQKHIRKIRQSYHAAASSSGGEHDASNVHGSQAGNG